MSQSALKYLTKPEEMPEHFARAWNQRDAILLASVFGDDADFVNVTGLWWHNRKAIEKAHEYGLRVIFNDSHLKTGRVKVRILSPDHAVVHARMRLSGQSPTGTIKKPGVRQNLFSFVMSRREEGWLCVSAHNTDIVPGKETHVRDSDGNLRAVDYRK